MAIYVPPARRRRIVMIVGGVALVVGGLIGVLVGRATAPSVDDQVRSSQRRASELAAGLRVLAIHQEADAASLQASADAGAELTLRRTEAALRDALGKAPWVPAAKKAELLGLIGALRGGPPGQATTPQFAQQVETAAAAIETAFGVRPG
jgi:hypothetical protein